MKIDPNEVIHSITMQDLLRALARHIGKEEASNLSEDDLALAKGELVAVLEHMNSDLLDEAIEAWSILRETE